MDAVTRSTARRRPRARARAGRARTSVLHALIVLVTTVIGRGRVQWSDDRLARAAMRRFRSAPEAPLPEARPPRLHTRGLTVTRADGDWPVWELRTRDAATDARSRADRVVIYFHGGAYIGQIGPLQWEWIGTFARRTGAMAVVPIYPLAPRGTASTVVPASADLITRAIETHGAEAVSVAGDSAGGGLALAALQELARRGSAPPARAALISPWLDVAVADPRSARIRDPLLRVPGLRAAGRLWAGELEPSDPVASPVHGSLVGLPPTFVLAGSRDMAGPDSARLAARAARDGADVAVSIAPGLIHDWPLVPLLPEARAAWPLLRGALVGDRC